MNQEKIGSFIAKMRKDKKMTQKDLAMKLGITDRAISKWENGRGLPDISLIKPRCEELDISLNELLSGEKIRKEEYESKFEENIINTIKYTNKETKKANYLFYIFLLMLIIGVSFLTLFFIDMNRMKKGEDVFFSTWGFDYIIPVSLDPEPIDNVIRNYFTSYGFSEWKHPHEHTFISTKIYSIEKNTLKDEYYVYTWILGYNYYLENNQVLEDSSFSIPYKFTLYKINNTYYVKDVIWPRDQPFYEDDLKKIFPASVRKEMDKMYHNDSFDVMQEDINKQVKQYYYETETS